MYIEIVYVCTYIYINMHICGQTNNHHPLIHCLGIILQCFCYLSASSTGGWCCFGIFWVIFIRFLLEPKSEQVWQHVVMHQSVNWRADTVESCSNRVVDIQLKEDLDHSLWTLELLFQYLDTGIAEANRNVSTDFSRSGGGPPLVLIFYQITFPITVFSSPPESGEVEYSRKKARKKKNIFF